MNPPTKTSILQEIAAIEAMEMGKSPPTHSMIVREPPVPTTSFSIGGMAKITPAMFRRRNFRRWRPPWLATPGTGN